MEVVVGARIDDRDRAAPDDIGAGAIEREGRGVRRDQPPHQRREPGERPRRSLPRVGEEIRFALVGHMQAPSALGRRALFALSWYPSAAKRRS